MDSSELRLLLNSWKVHGSMPSFQEVVNRMRESKPDASIQEVLQVERMRGAFDLIFTPDSVIEFIRAIIKQTNCHTLYVPFASGREIESLTTSELTIEYSTLNPDLRDLIYEKTSIAPVSNDSIDQNAFDVIFSDLPFGPIKKGCMQQMIVEDSAIRLTQKGIGLFTFANNIVFGIPAKKWLSELQQRGIYVNGIIDLPEGLYKPMTSIGSKLVLFSKTKTDKVFLAKLNRELDAPLIVDNYLTKRDSSKSKALGTWVERNSFPDYASIESKQRQQRIAAKLAKAYNAEMLPISKVAFDVVAPRAKAPSFLDAENAIYIPKVGKSDVLTSISELHLKEQNYFQILVNMEMVLPGYLGFFFNTDSGVTIRLNAMNGVTIPSLKIDSIRRMEVPIPSLKMQAAILDVYAKLDKIEVETSLLKHRLQEIPAAYARIEKELQEINNRGDKFELWVESLPYPLATILKRYATADNNQQKQEMLFYFFEAYSIFIATILTAIYRQPQFCESVIEDVGADYFEKASFGSWVRMDRALAKVFKELINDPKSIDLVLNSFHTDDRALVELLIFGDTFSILQRTCDYRNAWKGHSGITSEQIYADHVRILESELNKLQERLQDLYMKIRLIRPLSLKHRNGEFINRVEVLSGSNPIFRKDVIIGDALDEDKLYMQVVDTGLLFELPPFFVLKNSPAEIKNACYFYSRIEGSKSRYVSYHFEGKPEDTEEGEAAFSIIKAVLDNTSL